MLPLAIFVMAVAGALVSARPLPERTKAPYDFFSKDTVIYPVDGYKLHRFLDLEFYHLADSLSGNDTTDVFARDTTPRILARDTIKVPDSLRLIDPFRYKYYVALVDSLTHTIVRDSLLKRVDSLKASSLKFAKDSDFFKAAQDSTFAWLDSADRFRLDSLYASDSTFAAKAAFLAWYNSLSKTDRKKYDMEQKAKVKLAEMDSLQKISDEKKAIKDSIVQYTPRILETFALPDSMQYKRIIKWTVNQDFHEMDIQIPDTSYNYHYYDFPFQKKDVNATWLGTAGSPVQYYNYFKRQSDAGVEFYDAVEPWTYSPRTFNQYNTKTAYTELAYWGTLLAGDAKASDNVHLFTTQNILPELNFSLLYDRFGGGGELQHEKTGTMTFGAGINYVGKKYMLNAGYIHNSMEREESGGIVSKDREGRDGNFWVRDTTIEAREIPVALSSASSNVQKKSWFLDQQLRIPFDFIYKLKAKKDSTFVYDSVGLNRNITTAFIGHSTEFSTYVRKYSDEIGLSDTYGRQFYHDADGNYVYYYNPLASNDSLGVKHLDNKIFIKLQPWSDEAIVSKLNIGIGDKYRQYADSSVYTRNCVKENSVYLYAGVEGQYKHYFKWNAKGDYVVGGAEAGDFGISANANFNFYPFRKSKSSPVSVNAHFETSLRTPNYYQRHMYTNHFAWDYNLAKVSTMKIQGSIDIPYWEANAFVNYALLRNNVYYDSLGIARQNTRPISVLTAGINKNFTFGPLHLDNQVLFQTSSDQEVIPVPTIALNLRYYLQFVLQRNAAREKVLEMQFGLNGWYNSLWYSPAWNPNLGVFYNQRSNQYENGPYFDVFINMQWKRACIFIKFFNVFQKLIGNDYFSADHQILPTRGITGLKFGIIWPFYLQPYRNPSVKGGSGPRTGPGAQPGL